MPRSNREYLQRYTDQAINDMERCLERLQMLSDAYGGVYKPLDGEISIPSNDEKTDYTGAYAKYQKFVDIQAALIMSVYENMKMFRSKYV